MKVVAFLLALSIFLTGCLATNQPVPGNISQVEVHIPKEVLQPCTRRPLQDIEPLQDQELLVAVLTNTTIIVKDYELCAKRQAAAVDIVKQLGKIE